MATPRQTPVAFDRALVADLDERERRDLAAGLLFRAEIVRAAGLLDDAAQLEADARVINPLLIQ